MHYAAENGNVVSSSIKSMYNRIIRYPSITGHVDIVELLINNGANVNRQDPKGQTPLHFAVKSGKLNIHKFTCLFIYYKCLGKSMAMSIDWLIDL